MGKEEIRAKVKRRETTGPISITVSALPISSTPFLPHFSSPAANKMHDLDLVRIINDSLRPVGPANDGIVQLDRDALFG